MQRSIDLNIDQTTWPTSGTPPFPATFSAGASVLDLNVPTMLLVVGYLTTPTNTTGVALNEYWAWVRYVNAATTSAELRIANDFWQLDAHQKMILSDDFGMGVPMTWLTGKLGFRLASDGRYFIDRLAALVGATHVKTGKRGPSKSPDFVVLDSYGRWHVVECKGTQSGDAYRDRQVTSALSQKCTISFPPHLQGQRLACGLSLANESAPSGSSLTIVDPPNDAVSRFTVSEGNIEAAVDTASRAAISAGLKAAGFFNSAHAVAAPLGPNASTKSTKSGKRHRQRTEYVAERAKRVRTELDASDKRSTFSVRGESYKGREVRLALPKPVQIGGKEIRTVFVRQGVRSEVLESLKGEIEKEAPPELLATRPRAAKAISLEPEDAGATVEVDEFFLSQMELLA